MSLLFFTPLVNQRSYLMMTEIDSRNIYLVELNINHYTRSKVVLNVM